MPSVPKPCVRIAGTGHYVPSRVVTNAELATRVDTSDEWIRERTGIRERRIAGEDESTASMAALASRRAMERAEVGADEIDLLILSTSTPDHLLPATAMGVQARLRAKRAAAFDISAACSGWVFGLTVAEGMMMAGRFRTALVVGSEKMSAIVDWNDRSTSVLFGDGAGAVVLKRSEDNTTGILSSFMRSDGDHAELLWRPGGGAMMPISNHVLLDRAQYVKMSGPRVFQHAVRSMAEAGYQALAGASVTSDEIDLVIPHQANLRIIEKMAEHTGFPMDRVYVNVDRLGNTSSASIPIALDEVVKSGRVRHGSLVLFVAFGAGFNWAAMVVRL